MKQDFMGSGNIWMEYHGLKFSWSLGGEDLYKALKMLGQGHGIHGLEEILSLKFTEIYWILLAIWGVWKALHMEKTQVGNVSLEVRSIGFLQLKGRLINVSVRTG